MAEGGGGFSDHRHNKAEAMRIFHGGCFWSLGVVMKSGNIQKSRERDGGGDGGGDARCDDGEA